MVDATSLPMIRYDVNPSMTQDFDVTVDVGVDVDVIDSVVHAIPNVNGVADDGWEWVQEL